MTLKETTEKSNVEKLFQAWNYNGNRDKETTNLQKIQAYDTKLVDQTAKGPAMETYTKKRKSNSGMVIFKLRIGSLKQTWMSK